MRELLVESDALAPDATREEARRRRRAWARGFSSGGHAESDRLPHRDDLLRMAESGVKRTLSEPKWSVDVAAVERHRIVRGWSRLELAGIAHVDPKTLRDLLGQRRRPNLGTVQAVCVALGLTLSDVVRFS